jgi:hypothetical protein
VLNFAIGCSIAAVVIRKGPECRQLENVALFSNISNFFPVKIRKLYLKLLNSLELFSIGSLPIEHIPSVRE